MQPLKNESKRSGTPIRLGARLLAAAALFALPLVVACSVPGESDVVEPVASDEAPIITGHADPGHPAVVSLQMTKPGPTYSSCTGTIVGVNTATKMAYVLTAAHCVRGATSVGVTQGANIAQPGNTRFAYVDHTAHPQYDGQTTSPYDVAMVRVLGADASTPVIPMLSSDAMVQGQTRVTSVGFGRTVRPGSPSDAGANTQKNRIDGTIVRLTGTQVGVRYDNNGDICQGDSGGPVLTVASGKEYVAAVHSFVTGACVGVGYSVRASAHKAFFQTIVNTAAPEETCEQCKKVANAGNQICVQQRKACTDDPQCNGLRTCVNACTAGAMDAGTDAGAGTEECRKACSVQFPFGAGPYNTQIAFCACKACDAKCGGDPSCATVPKCGMKLVDETCTTCMEGSCCAQASACGADGHCYRCTKNPETEGCATDPLYAKLQACRATSCGSACTANAAP